MNKKFAALASAMSLVFAAGVANADAHANSEVCVSMLATAVGMQLETEGFDMANACELSISDLALIKNLLETEGMGSRVKIEKVLSDAG